MSLPTTPLTRIRALFSSARKRLLGENGDVLLIVVLAMPVIMGCAAFAIDVANVWAARQHVQSVADAAALAGAQDLTGTGTTYLQAPTDATKYANANLGKNSTADVTTSNPGAKDTSMTVGVSQNVPMFFSGLFGMHDATVHASATATNTETVSYSKFEADNNLQTSGGQPVSSDPGNPNAPSWYNFCAADNESTAPANLVTNQGGGCSATNHTNVLNENGDVVLTVVHGGVDASPSSQKVTGSFMNGAADANGDNTVMFDLTGTCVEQSGTGGCLNNADGEVQLTVSDLVPGDTYDVTFDLSANTGGPPKEKPVAVAVSSTPFSKLDPMANTQGTSTTYPLEDDMTKGKLAPGTLLAYQEYAYASVDNGYTQTADNPWVLETLSFTASSDTAYVAFGSLENCVGDNTKTSVNQDTFTDGIGLPEAVTLPSSTSSYTTIPAQSYDNPGQQHGGCRFGPAISNWAVGSVSSNGIALTK